MDDSAPIAPRPDVKDWTWVLERRCSDCGFDPEVVDVTSMPAQISANASCWAEVLGRDDVRRRPAPTVWSPLEYATHVRDVFRLFGERLEMMLTDTGPSFPNWDQDATAIAERYDLGDPDVVRLELVAAGEALAARFAAVAGDDWRRTGFRSDGAVFTVDSFARYFIHDPIHHLWDVGAGERAAVG